MRSSIKTALLVATSFTLLTPGLALAGRGGSTTLIVSAIASKSDDAIVAEVERAEFLACLSCIDVVRSLVDYPTPRVRNVAGWWLGRRGVRSGVISDMTARLTSGQDPVAARNAADVLAAMRDVTTAPTLAAYLGHPLDEDSAVSAVVALGEIGDPALLPALQGATTSPMAKVRAAAAAAILRLRAPIGQTAVSDGSGLTALFTDSDATVRAQATLTAGRLAKTLNPSLIPALIALTTDSDASVRKGAVWALGRNGNIAAQQAIIAAQNDSDSGVRSTAHIALAGIKP